MTTEPSVRDRAAGVLGEHNTWRDEAGGFVMGYRCSCGWRSKEEAESDLHLVDALAAAGLLAGEAGPHRCNPGCPDGCDLQPELTP